LEYLIVGATAIQVGTANFINPRATMDILDGIEAFMLQNRIGTIKQLINTLQT
jgi:dihydroorotate dehydrogenase (NAD+) catalytic subunit